MSELRRIHDTEQEEAAERDFMKLWGWVWPMIHSQNPDADHFVIQRAAWHIYRAGEEKGKPDSKPGASTNSATLASKGLTGKTP